MKKYILHLFAAACVIMTLCACNQAESKIDDLRDLVTEVERNYKSYSQEEWRGVSEAYNDLIVEMQQYDYDTDERKEIGRLKGTYEAIAVKYTVSNFKDIVTDYADELMEGVEGFVNEITEDLDGDSVAG